MRQSGVRATGSGDSNTMMKKKEERVMRMKRRGALFCLMIVFTVIGIGICTVMNKQDNPEQPDAE